MPSPKRMKKKSINRQEYTLDDQKKILEYVISQRQYYYLRGNAFWQQMEKKRIIDRTWQSVKEHFKKRIMENLHLYKLPPKDFEALKEGWNSTSKAVKERCGNPSKRPKYKLRSDFSDDDNYEITDSDESLPPKSTKTNNKNIVNQPVILSDSSSDAIVAVSPKKIQVVSEESIDSDVTADLDIPNLQQNDTFFTENFSPCLTSTQITPKKSATASTSKWITKVSGISPIVISGKPATEEVSSDLDEASGSGRKTNESSNISRLLEKYCGKKASANVAVRQKVSVNFGKASGSKPKTKPCRNQKVSPNQAETSIENVSANSVAASDSLLFPSITQNKNVSPIVIIETSSSGRMSKVSPQILNRNYKTSLNSSENSPVKSRYFSDSPDTTILLKSPPSKSANEVNELTNQLPDISLDPVPTVSGFMSTTCPRCSKNGSQDEEVFDETLENWNATISPENDRFSKEEDIDLLTFITDNKSCLQNRNNIAVYEFYKILHGSLRSPRTLRKRFLKNIFPNIDTDKEETCKDAPNNLENRPPDRIPNPNTSENVTQTDTSSNLIIKDVIHPVYCRLKLRGDHHIFAATTNQNQEKITKKLSRKFRIWPENFHSVYYDSNDLSKLTVCFRKALLDNCGEFIKACLDNENDLEALISNAEICVQPFISDGSSTEDTSENSGSESENQEEYMPLNIVKQEIIPEDSNSNLVQIKQENCSFGHNSSHLDEHNYSGSSPQRFVKEETPSPCSTEMLDTSLESCKVTNVLGKFEEHLPDSPEMPTSSIYT